ncbi:MAG: DUF3016 domain-containing protein, partial [Comamonadaceae bacterium]
MRPLIKSSLAALVVLAATTGAAWAQVSVSYVKPDEFIDVPRSPID